MSYARRLFFVGKSFHQSGLSAAVGSAEHDAVSLTYVEGYAAAEDSAFMTDCKVRHFEQSLILHIPFL